MGEALVKWMPRYSGSDRLGGCIWLGRLIDKARRYDSTGTAPDQMLGDYMYGDGDYLDGKLLRFLGLHDAQISEVVRNEPDDERAAQRILERSRKTTAECEAFNRTFARMNGPFLAMIDIDEGRRKPGLGALVIKAAYNALVFPIGIVMFRSANRKRTGA
jgi:hypothetical protein